MNKPGSNGFTGPPLLEQLGALCSLLAHDLANQLCVISGSASFAQMVLDDPKRLATALDAITRASETAGHAVSSFGEYRRTLPATFKPGPARGVIDAFQDFANHAGWKCVAARDVRGSLLLPPEWAVFAASTIKMEIYSKPVVLHLQQNNPRQHEGHNAGRLPIQGARWQPGLHIRFDYASSRTFSIKEIRARHENLGLLAVFELNRMLGGEVDSRTPSPGRQEIDLWLPFVEDESNPNAAPPAERVA